MQNDCLSCLKKHVSVAPWRMAIIVEGKIQTVNSGFAEILGMPEAEVIGKEPDALLPGLDVSDMARHTLASVRPMLRERESSIRGKTRDLRVYTIPTEERHTVLIAISDLTAQRESQAGIAYQMVEEDGADDFWVFDRDRNLVFTNATRLADVPIPAGRDILSLLTPESQEVAEGNFAWAQDNPGETVHFRLEVMRGPGKPTTTINVDGKFVFDDERGHFLCVLRGPMLEGAGILKRLQMTYSVTTDAELAKKLRASPARISAVRNGQAPVARTWVWRAFEETGESMDWIATGKGKRRLGKKERRAG